MLKVLKLMHPSGAAGIKGSDVWLAFHRYAKSTDKMNDFQEINECFILQFIKGNHYYFLFVIINVGGGTINQASMP